MTITTAQYLHSLETVASRLPATLQSWHLRDEDLQIEHAEQIEWLLHAHANMEFPPEGAVQVNALLTTLWARKDDLESLGVFMLAPPALHATESTTL